MIAQFMGKRGVIIVAVILLIVAVAALGQRLTVLSGSPLSLVADDFRTGGGAGVILWAKKLGITTLPLRVPLWELNSELSQRGHCAITAGNGSWQPFGDELEREQWHEISRWVQAGNALIIISSVVDSLPEPVAEHFTANVPTEQKPRLVGGSEQDWGADEPEVVNLPSWWGGELAVSESGPRLNGAPDDWVLAGSPESAVLVKRPLGEGVVYLMLDEHAWANAGLDRADNAAALARILKDELQPGGVLAIDQYRHGRGRVESFATFLLALPGAGAFLAMSLIIGLFWLWAGNRRLGPPEEFHESHRRTAQEYVDAVAALNQRARAAPLAVGAVAERVNYLLYRRGHDGGVAAEVIDRARRHIRREQRPASPVEEIQLVNELIELRRTLYGTRPHSRAD